MKYCDKKTKAKMIFRTIGLIALGLLVSSITPIVYGPLAIIAAPWAIGVCIWASIELNREDIAKAKREREEFEERELKRAALAQANAMLKKDAKQWYEAEG